MTLIQILKNLRLRITIDLPSFPSAGPATAFVPQFLAGCFCSLRRLGDGVRMRTGWCHGEKRLSRSVQMTNVFSPIPVLEAGRER